MNSPCGSLHSATSRRRSSRYSGIVLCRRKNRVSAPRVRDFDTPSIRWKFDDDRRRRSGAVDVSARKLAASLWQSHLMELKSSLLHPKSTMEGATKLDSRFPRTSNEVYRICSDMKLPEKQKGSSGCAVSSLQSEVSKARKRIHELEGKCRFSENTVRHLLRKFGEERASWKSIEHQKTLIVIDNLKNELDREKRHGTKMEILYSKLVNELAYVKVTAKKFMQHYEEEKRERRLMEEVCNEIAKEIGEDKMKFEALKKELTKVREEVEEERKMLQLAEVWREERVQMKLVDAKLALEDKYFQMNKLLTDLETFLGLRNATLEVQDLTKAELIHQAVKSVDIQNIKEFIYIPPELYDIFSIFKEFQHDEANEEIESCINYTSISHASEIHTVIPNPKVNAKHENGNINNKDITEATSGCKTSYIAKYQGSSYSLEDVDPSMDQNCRGRNVTTSVREWDVNAGQAQSETSEGSSISVKQSKEESTISKLFRLRQSNGEIYKIVSDEVNRRLGSGEVLKHQDMAGKWRSQNSGNPHVARGMKRCIEWPQGNQKSKGQASGRMDRKSQNSVAPGS